MTMIEAEGSDLDVKGALIAPVPRVSIHAFCESQSLASLLGVAAADRRMQKASVKTRMGGIAMALETYRQEQTPNVIVLETGSDRASFLADLDGLAEFCDDSTRVVVFGHINDITLYRALIARGVSDYLVEPFDALDLIRVISELYGKPGAAPLGRIIAVYGAKGGVGASMVAHHLAWSIATTLDMATVIADFDLPFGTAGLDFNLDPLQGLAEAAFSSDRLDGNMLDRLMTKCGDKLNLLAAPATLAREYDFDQDAFDSMVDLLRASAPAVVLDIPHMWTGWTKRLLLGADEVVLVAEPDLGNLRNVKNLLDLLGPARVNDAKPKLVMNRVALPKRPEIDVKEFATGVNIIPALTIPFDSKSFGTAANNGQMVAEVSGGARFGAMFESLARQVVGRPEMQKVTKGSLIESLKSTKLPFSFAKKA